MRHLSKSKILAFRQCRKRLWLEIHRPDLKDDSKLTTVFQAGNQVGEVARTLYDPGGCGVLIDAQTEGYEEAIARSTNLLVEGGQPVFEAGMKAGGCFSFADVMLPDRSDGRLRWRMVEVKSTASVKPYQRDDIAVQTYVAVSAGVSLASATVAHIDTSFVYRGDGDYRGLLKEIDLTAEALSRCTEVAAWIADAQAVAELPEEPLVETGPHCNDPFDCGFRAYCNRGKVVPDFPISFLPRLHPTRRVKIEQVGYEDLREIPDDLLNELQQRVKEHSDSGQTYFDALGAAQDLAPHTGPAYFLDFETIAFAVPIWKGTRPYQQIPFQFSLHLMQESGALDPTGFLDLSGNDPTETLAFNLMDYCGHCGPVFVYNAPFEKAIIRGLSERYPKLAGELDAINRRIVDLLPITRNRYYHPAQQGSWSLKAVIPTIASTLAYDQLEGVRDGSMAQRVFLEAIAADTTFERRKEIEAQLIAYCKLDTEALVRLWHFLGG
jgi:hypothetical protein